MILLGLTGFPLAHSLSPEIHRAALDFFNLKGNYSLYPVPGDDPQGLKVLLECVRSGELIGLNVTIPHKQAVIPLLDELTPQARAVGAVNTIVHCAGKLLGDNTDISGFKADLYQSLPIKKEGRKDKCALILGAGGAARAVVYALLMDGWRTNLVARRLGSAQALIAQFPQAASAITAVAWNEKAIRGVLADTALIVNATPLGMSPHTDNSPWPENVPFPDKAAVYDLVYNPRETKLVRTARAAGLPAVTGLGMLVEQAALSFETWTSRHVPREVLFTAVEEA